MPDDRFGGRIGAVVALERPDRVLDLSGSNAHLLANGVGKEYLPERLLVVESIPVSMGGKADKARLKRLFTTPNL